MKSELNNMNQKFAVLMKNSKIVEESTILKEEIQNKINKLEEEK
jgi:hypothetical protein